MTHIFAATASLLVGQMAVPLTPPATQPDRSQPASEIVVVARDRDLRSRDEQVRDMVRIFTPTVGPTPLARFDRQLVCPKIYGLSVRHADFIAARLHRIANAAKVPIDRIGCPHVNTLIIFTDSKLETFSSLRINLPALTLDENFGRQSIVAETGPALAWRVRRQVTRDGAPIDPVTKQVRTTGSASRLRTTARPSFDGAVVIVERGGIDGLTTTQVADYVAMRAFSDASPERAHAVGANSIVTVLDAPPGSSTPVTLTAWDLAFLKGLYASAPNAFSGEQRSQIGRVMRDELNKPAASTPD